MLIASDSYEALSYTWGDPNQQTHIIVNENRVAITITLDQALRGLRYAEKKRIVWVDALCINQHDLAERSAQVRQMGMIYRSADQVIIWLGPASRTSPIALQYFKRFHQHRKCCFDMSITFGSAAPSIVDQAVYECREWSDGADFDMDTRGTVIRAIDELLGRDWWGRLWIVQELAMAMRDPLLLCGADSAPWSAVADFAVKSGGKSLQLERVRLLQKIRQDVRTPPRLRPDYATTPDESIHRDYSWLLRTTRDFECSDERDHIFAVLSMMRSTQATAIPIDYTTPSHEVYSIAAKVHRQRIRKVVCVFTEMMGSLSKRLLTCP